MTKPELKPCKYCNEYPEIFDTDSAQYYVMCGNSWASVECFYMTTDLFDTKQEAINVWNQRNG